MVVIFPMFIVILAGLRARADGSPESVAELKIDPEWLVLFRVIGDFEFLDGTWNLLLTRGVFFRRTEQP
ncbi:MAG: hypothetical protein ACKO2G_10155 [Verrucomicrobiales bacterium]